MTTQVPNGWELAPALVNLGDGAGRTGRNWPDRFDANQNPSHCRWLNLTYSLHSLLYEINQRAARFPPLSRRSNPIRISTRPRCKMWISTRDLDWSLLILHNEYKNIHVRREYDPRLPRILAYGSQLNQVWTNLIDNACDALETPSRTRNLLLRTTGTWEAGSWFGH